MLSIEIPESELYDEESQRFFKSPGATLLLEHSLVSLSKWEVIWGKPFLNGVKKTTDETRSYIDCMNLAPVDSLDIYRKLSNADMLAISNYIDAKQTATWFIADPYAKPSTEAITSEIIYYWMIAHNIPFETQYWHLNRLTTLIKVCNEKNKPATKSRMGRQEQAQSRRMLNAQRKAQMGTNG